MSTHLQVFIVSKNPKRCIAFEYNTNDGDGGTPLFDVELIIWGMDRDQDFPSTVEMLMRRGWQLDKIKAAINRALKQELEPTI